MATINHLIKFSNSRKLPITLQSEAAECGLACIVMISSFYGHKIDLTTARAKFNISLKGATIDALVNIAEKLSLIARPLRAEMRALPKLQLPIILHWDMSHFVVLKKVNKNRVIIHDPAKGRIELSLDEFSDHFTGVALELTPSNDFKHCEETKNVKISDFWNKIYGLKQNLIKIFILSFFLQLFVIAGPLLQQMVVDDAIIMQDSDFLLVLILGGILIGLFQMSISYVRAKVMLYLSNTLSFQMTSNLFRHLIRLPASYFEKRKIGDVTTRFGSLAPIQSMITSGVIAVVLDAIMALSTLAMALMYSTTLTVVIIGFIFINFLLQLSIFPHIKRSNEKIIELGAKEESIFLENIQAAITIKTFGQEGTRENIWLNRRADTMNASISLANFNINFGLLTSLLALIQSVVIMYMGAMQVINGNFSLGMLFAYQSYSSQCSGKISALITQFFSFRMLDMHLKRLADIVTEEPEIRSTDSNILELNKDEFCANISFEHISFRYGDNEPWILNDINFKVMEGEMIAITGLSGVGKSTVLKLMLGLLKPNQGTVFLDRENLSNINPQAYRKHIGVVMQDDKLLSGTIAENISFFEPHYDFEWVTSCAKIACVHEDIRKNPMGYNTLIGDMGSTLSGGQKQRLLLARALYKKPKILFLDEGTANLDSETEKKIALAIRQMKITRIIIAHRPELINISDNVFELNANGMLETSKVSQEKVAL